MYNFPLFLNFLRLKYPSSLLKTKCINSLSVIFFSNEKFLSKHLDYSNTYFSIKASEILYKGLQFNISNHKKYISIRL